MPMNIHVLNYSLEISSKILFIQHKKFWGNLIEMER